MYYNGSEVTGYAVQDSAVSPINTSDEPLYIGSHDSGEYWDGIIDEVRISSVARTAGWIQTSFNNQNNPSAFYGLGDEKTVTLSEASTGQITDQFDDSPSLNDVTLFRFRLWNNSDSSATIDQIVFHLSGVSGISAGDLSDLKICLSAASCYSLGDPTVQITGDTGTLTFDEGWSISPNFGTDWYLRGDVANLGTGDTLTISLAPSDVTLISGRVVGTAPPSDVTHTTNPTVVTIQGSYDDAHESDGGLHFEPLEVYVNITQYISGSNSKFNGGFRFAGIDIPQGSTINSAIFSGYVYDTNQDDMYATIYGHAADNSPDFTAPNDSIIDTGVRPRTSASVAWQETFGSTGWKNKDVTSIVQEIINRPGWSNDNAITLLFISDNDTMPKPCYFRSYDGVPAEAAKLTIDYTPTPTTVAIYYSVGTGTGPLYSGDASASSGTLTLEGGPAADNIGVGDEIREGLNRYYITGRNSSTEFTIQNSAANGGTPGDIDITFGSTAIEIYRAFNLLSAAESRVRDTDYDYLKTGNLVTGNYQLNLACYADGVMTDSVLIDGDNWTTGSANYIKIYTPTLASEVGVSQRHDGTWGTGFRMTPASGNNAIQVCEDYVRIEGIAVYVNNTSAISVNDTYASFSTNNDVRISHCLLTGTGSSSRALWASDTGGNLKLTMWNTIAYNHGSRGFYFDNVTAYCYNCTAYNNAAYGFHRDTAGTVILKNCISMAHTSNDYVGTFDASSDYNMSSDASAPGTHSLHNRSASDNFVSISAGSEDLHLKYGADAIGKGINLLSSFTTDIDGEVRSNPWDIGADEYYLEDTFVYRKQITIDHTKVACDLTDFPMLVSIQNDPDLKTTANGGKVANTNGYDIIFKAWVGATQLSHEVEKYDGTTGTLVAWVKIPTLKADEDTVIYMDYGDSTITESQENAAGVWDSNYAAVWHLKETTGGSGAIKNSTSYSNDGTNSAGLSLGATGKINGAIYFDGAGDYVTVPSPTNTDPANLLTVSA
ncbi:MAG: hypothetical protein AMJ46_14485, partial [Latescibacteria bacterium DG_63]